VKLHTFSIFVFIILMSFTGRYQNNTGLSIDNADILPPEWFVEIDGKSMTLDDVRQLSEIGYNLRVEDFLIYKGTNGMIAGPSYLDKYSMVYDVQGGHRLVVRANQNGIIEIVSFTCEEQIFVNGEYGIGIEIRSGNVDEYLRTYSNG